MLQRARVLVVGSPLAILMASGVLARGAEQGAAEGAANAAAKAPAAQEKALAAMEKGLGWLQAHQRENGAWSNDNYPALTALGLWAAARSGLPAMTGVCAKAAAFVAGFAQEDGGIYKPATGGRGSGGLSTYNTALCMTALYCYDRTKYAPMILKARQFVAASQLQGDSAGAGGFGYDQAPPPAPSRADVEKMMAERAKREGKPAPTEEEVTQAMARMGGMSREARADLSNTGWALMAMRMTQDLEDTRPGTSKRADVDWEAAVKFVEKLQNTDENDKENHGGFGYESAGERGGTSVSKEGVVTLRGFGSMTYAGLESMIYAQVGRDDARVRSALQWASRHWALDENPGMGLKGLFYYYNILAKALNLAGGDALLTEKGEKIQWREQLIAQLVGAQKPDGSWANTDNTFWESDPALVTAYAVLTLEYAAGK